MRPLHSLIIVSHAMEVAHYTLKSNTEIGMTEQLQ